MSDERSPIPMPAWVPIPTPRCKGCSSELVPRSRTTQRMLACQNWRCREFDRAVAPRAA